MYMYCQSIKTINLKCFVITKSIILIAIKMFCFYVEEVKFHMTCAKC